MKIAILADSLDTQSAGIHTYTRQLVEALIQFDLENEYILIREKKDPKLPIEQIVIPNIHLPIGFAAFRLFFIIPFILRNKKVDAVLEPAHFGPFNLPKRIKRITMIHDLTPIIFPQFHRYRSQVLQRIFFKRILQNADLILANSQNTSNDLIKVFPFTESKINTILLGRDADYQPTSAKTYLEKKGVQNPYFLFTGTLEPRKNIIVLLDAYRSLRDKTKTKANLIIVGKKGWKTESIYEKLEKHPYREDIILTGYIQKNELVELYSHALALVYPSLYEGFGLPILEALSCGTRVICSDNSSLPEVGGDVSLYFDAKDETGLVKHMIKVIEDSEAGIDYTEALLIQAKKFSWEKYVVEFRNVLNKLHSAK